MNSPTSIKPFIDKIHKCHSPAGLHAVLLLFFIFLFPFKAYTQNNNDCDEVLVLLKVEGVGNTQLSSIICQSEIYLSVTEVLDFIHIKNDVSSDYSLIEGFFINPENHFLLDQHKNQFTLNGKTLPLEADALIKTNTNLYLKPAHFKAFGLNTVFEFSSLSVTMVSDQELPLEKLARQESMRAGIKYEKFRKAADTVISRGRPLLHLGMITWGFNGIQREDGARYNRYNLGLGGLILGGELNTELNFNSQQPFLLRNQKYNWRYVNNDNNLLRQISLGTIRKQSISTIHNNIVGVQLTNTPTYIKKTFGTYTLSDHTEPNWMVELYINNVLTDYTQADAVGFFTFEVPLIYGNTSVTLRFYGPFGEERAVNRSFNIPFNFLPEKSFEYTFSTGVVEDRKNNMFFNGRVNYGLSQSITVGGGAEYFAGSGNPMLMPFLNASVRAMPNLLFATEYIHKVGYRGTLSYSALSGIRLNFNYKNYEKGQTAVRYRYLEEREAIISSPIKNKLFSGNSRFILRQNVYSGFSTIYSELMLTGRIRRINFNLNTVAYYQGSHSTIYSRLSSHIRLPKNIIFSPQIQYEFSGGKITSLRAELRKEIFKKAYLNIGYERNFKNLQTHFQMGFRYDLNFGRFSLSASRNNQQTMFSQSAMGGIIIDPRTNYVKFDNNSTLGRASVKFVPFLDKNCNGKKDADEHHVEGVNINIREGIRKEPGAGGVIVYNDLEPYVNYYFEINSAKLDRISWQIKHENLNVNLNPNQMKVVEIPVIVVGEVAGYVLRVAKKSKAGLGGIKVDIYSANRTLVQSINSESDGYFTYLGLKPGTYSAQVDTIQLKKLNLTSASPIVFTIKKTTDGDFIDNIVFELIEITGDNPIAVNNSVSDAQNTEITDDRIFNLSVKNIDSEIATKSQSDNSSLNNNKSLPASKSLEIIEDTLTNQGLVFKVQVKASYSRVDSSYFKGLDTVEEHLHNRMYKYTSGKSKSFAEANKIKNKLRNQGFTDAFVVPFYKNKRVNPGEITGFVFLNDKTKVGLGGINIKIYDLSHELITTTLSETDGSFKIIGLTPSRFKIELDEAQLNRIQMSSKRTSLIFEIHTNNLISNDINFVLEPKKAYQAKAETTKTDRDTLSGEGLVFKIQILASKERQSIKHKWFKELEGVQREYQEGYYKYFWGEAKTLEEIRKLKEDLSRLGFEDSFIVPFLDRKRISLQEVFGKVYFQSDNESNGIEGLKIHIYGENDVLITTLLSNHDGRFGFLGLKPGNYTATVDKEQLRQIDLIPNEPFLNFKIRNHTKGNRTIPLEFILKADSFDSTEKLDEDVPVFKVQIAASIKKLPPNDPAFKNRTDAQWYKHNGMYKYVLGETQSLEKALLLRDSLRSKGFSGAFIVAFLNDKRISIPSAKKKTASK
jgi:hypothetical protein